MALYEERLIPAARQSVSSTEASYRAGTADFEALVAAHEAALEFELSLERARADVVILNAKLARLTGADEWAQALSGGAEGEETE